MSAKLTPKDFAPHLLAVLAELVEYEADVSVLMSETYALVCARMKIDENMDGGTSAHGTPFTHRQIGLAFRQQLRKKGLGENEGRGQWMLTEEGVAQARENSSAVVPDPVTPKAIAEVDFDLEALLEAAQNDPEPTPDPAPEPEPTPPPKIAIAVPEPPPPKMEETVQLPVIPQRHEYSDDPYIRELGAQTTACFGHWSSGEAVCSNCPLRTDCQFQQQAVLGNLGAQMLQEENPNHAAGDEPEEETVENILQVYADDEDNSFLSGPSKFKPAPGVRFETATVDVPTMCNHCKRALDRGTIAKWAHGEGYYHTDCFDDS